MEVISNLIKIRLKPKVLLNHYMLCVRSVYTLTTLLRVAGLTTLTFFKFQLISQGTTVLGDSHYLGLDLGTLKFEKWLSEDCSVHGQGAAQRAQRQPGHNGQVGHLQRVVQCQEPQQHAGSSHVAATQPRAGAKGDLNFKFQIPFTDVLEDASK